MIEDRLRGPWKHTPTGLIVRAEGVLIVPADSPAPDPRIALMGTHEGPAKPIAVGPMTMQKERRVGR